MSDGGERARGPAPGVVDHANLLSLLGTTRTLTKIWVVIGAVVGLLNLLTILYSLFTLRFPGSGLAGLVYAVIWVGVDLLIVERMGGWIRHVARGEYQVLKEPLLLWGLLGLIFGVVPGILLLLAYFRVLPWTDNLAPGSGPKDPAPSAAVPLPPSSPAQAPSSSSEARKP